MPADRAAQRASHAQCGERGAAAATQQRRARPLTLGPLQHVGRECCGHHMEGHHSGEPVPQAAQLAQEEAWEGRQSGGGEGGGGCGREEKPSLFPMSGQ